MSVTEFMCALQGHKPALLWSGGPDTKTPGYVEYVCRCRRFVWYGGIFSEWQRGNHYEDSPRDLLGASFEAGR